MALCLAIASLMSSEASTLLAASIQNSVSFRGSRPNASCVLVSYICVFVGGWVEGAHARVWI